jgi:hypothetical protein
MMTESLQEVVAARRRWKMIAIALLVALVGSLAMTTAERAKASPSGDPGVNARADLPFPERLRAHTVEAQEIVLKDGEGHVRARFSARGETARLVIYDAQGKAVASLPEKARVKELGQ